MLDNRFASSLTATRITVLTYMYTKQFNKYDDMTTYVDEFKTFFAELKRIGADSEITESHKAPLHLDSMENTSRLKSTVAALRTKDIDKLTWKNVRLDLIPE